MRKLLSLCLLFALAFSVVTVHAEQEEPDPVGEWEMIMYNESVYVNLQADGKMISSVVDISAGEDEEPYENSIEGTWTFDGKTLKLVSNEGIEEILQWDTVKKEFVYESGDSEFIMKRLDEDASEIEDGPEVPLAGGWQTATDPTVTEDMEKMLQAALEDFQTDTDTVSYTPIACLGNQVVAGTNHAILCQAKKNNEASGWVIIYLYEDLQNEITVMNIADFDFGSLCTYGAE